MHGNFHTAHAYAYQHVLASCQYHSNNLHPFVLVGGCKWLLRNFRPQVTLHDLDRDDGFKLVSEQFKIRGNDLLDLYLNHDFTVEIIGALKKIQSREQGASLVTNIRKRARGDDDQANVHLLHHLPCLAVYCCQNISPALHVMLVNTCYTHCVT